MTYIYLQEKVRNTWAYKLENRFSTITTQIFINVWNLTLSNLENIDQKAISVWYAVSNVMQAMEEFVILTLRNENFVAVVSNAHLTTLLETTHVFHVMKERW